MKLQRVGEAILSVERANLEDVAVHGPIKIIHGNISALFIDPTWRQICQIVDKRICATADYDHKFVEGVSWRKGKNGVKHVKIIVGS